jgi:hypothetical protein
MQTLIASDADGRMLFALEMYEGKRRRLTPRKVKKFLKTCAGVVRVERVTTTTLDGAGNDAR